MHRPENRLCVAAMLTSMVMSAPTLSAQAGAKRTPDQIQASFAAHKGEFDYLLGDWEFTGTNQQYGKIHGYWSAVRLDKGQILDEYVGHELPTARGASHRAFAVPGRSHHGQDTTHRFSRALVEAP